MLITEVIGMAAGRVVAVLLGAPMVAAAATVAAVVGSGAHRRLGASEAEAGAVLPGDELLPEADVQNDRACTIDAPPAAVWPWIAQLGQDKAGFYSFEMLENLAGCRITGADRVHPEWTEVKPGDPFRLHPDVALRVAEVEPDHHLVVTSQGGDAPGEMDFATTWAFRLSPHGSGTRLHLRERYETRSKGTRRTIEVTSVVSAFMTWRMMSRLQSLVPDARGG